MRPPFDVPAMLQQFSEAEAATQASAIIDNLSALKSRFS